MRTVDRVEIAAPADRVFDAARDVERWPSMLPHYRWVKKLDGQPGGPAVVEMAAWRPFGVFRWPTWWVSEMTVEPDSHIIRYRHIRGITRGMDVAWRIRAAPPHPLSPSPVSGEGERGGGTIVEIVHEWDGPAWPVISRIAANLVIGPVFIHGIASRTLAGIKRYTETLA